MSGQQLNIKRRNQKGSSEIAEFVPALYVLFIIVLFPLLNLVNCFVAATVQYLAVNDIASKASTQPDYSTALSEMVTESGTFAYSNLSKFSKLQPIGGYMGCGNDLYVLKTSTTSGITTASAPDQNLPQPISTNSTTYEFQVKSQYSVAPLISFASIPLFSDVPGLGKPVNFTFTANRPVEHPDGLQTASSSTGTGTGGSGTGSGNLPMFPRQTVDLSASASSIWRNPNIYATIAQQGQTVASVNVAQVQFMTPGYATQNNNWSNSGVVVAPNQKIWVDTQSAGLWHRIRESTEDTNPNIGVTADGGTYTTGNMNFQYPAPTANIFSLIGYICADTTHQKSPWTAKIVDQFAPTDPTLLAVGSSMQNAATTTGGGTLLFSANSRICPGWNMTIAQDVSFNGTDCGILGGTVLPYPTDKVTNVHQVVATAGVIKRLGYQVVRVIVTN